MANPSVSNRPGVRRGRDVVAVLLVAAALVGVTGSAGAASQALGNASIPHWFDQTVYRPNCLQIEYDQHCLFDGCAWECGPR
jgi:hypothetical protein